MNGVIYDGSMLSNTHVVNQSTPKKGNLEHANSLKSFLKQDSADKLDHDKLNELAERLTDLHHFYTLRIEQ